MSGNLTATISELELRLAGFEVLHKALGPAATARFLRSIVSSPGDYTAERHYWLGDLTIDDIVDMAHAERERRKALSPSERPPEV